ncbi:MAG: tRNA pseudouridine(13) synthase TruD [Candidatus Undinarchaeales archaeon]
MDNYKRIGVTTFFTKTEGAGGEIKENPKDFIVQEIPEEGNPVSLEPSPEIPEGEGDQTRFTLVKRDWNQSKILQKISRRCGVSRKRFSYAGTKDKYALTAQRISAWKVGPGTLSKISFKDCKIGDFSFAKDRLELGDLWGNRFTITLSGPKNPENAEKTIKKLKKAGGIPNFFGRQRFGIRLNNHLVGKEMFRENLGKAVRIFLTGTIESEGEEGRKARQKLEKNWPDFKQALKDFPNYMRFERAVLDRLNRYPKDYVGAFKQLPKFLYKIFTHSYQSYIFNLILSEKIEKNESLDGEGNLVGYDSDLTERELELLEKDGLQQTDLRINSFPEASVKGSRRPYLAKVKNLKSKKENSDIILNFDLEKGAYATVLLREIIKQ